jgi:predicted SAM-dependent methyltransferase
MESIRCRICENTVSADYILKEMMFGLRDKFDYGECSNCGCIQIMKVPDNIDKYYPPYYVSFLQATPILNRLPFLKRLFKNRRMKRQYRKSSDETLQYLKPIHANASDRILDIGCGKGMLICKLFNLGFENVTGVDKFINKEIDHGYGVKVLKKNLSEIKTGSYNILILHHVLEHLDEQVKELSECNRLLKKGGKLIISIPLLGEAWDIYKENWVQADAPRHFLLHTLASMGLLAQKTGFTINNTLFDSTAFQFLGSELYKNDIPLTLPTTHEWYPFSQEFSQEQILNYTKEADNLNKKQRGDTATFYLSKNIN